MDHAKSHMLANEAIHVLMYLQENALLHFILVSSNFFSILITLKLCFHIFD